MFTMGSLLWVLGVPGLAAHLTLAMPSLDEGLVAEPPALPRIEPTRVPPFGDRCRAIARRHGARVHLDELGRSPRGLPIEAVVIEPSPRVPACDRREVVLVAGLEADQLAGSIIAVELLDRLTRGEELGTPEAMRLTVIPRAHADGLASWQSTPLAPSSAVGDPLDEDRDRLADEDGPDDLDGDQRILTMRWRSPDGEWIPDPDEPRLMRKADRSKGEVGIYEVSSEGLDDDDDGEVNEDGPGGLEPAVNFPHAWPEHSDRAGQYPLQHPVARAVVDLLLARPQTGLVVVLGSFDSVTRDPETGEPASGWPRKPATRVLPADLPVFQILGRAFRESQDFEEESGKSSFPAGDLAGYVYFQLGLPVVAHPLWRAPRPEAKEGGDEEDGEAGGATQQTAPPPRPTSVPAETAVGGATGQVKRRPSTRGPRGDDPLAEDRRWLALADRQGEGFVAWRAIAHPDLREVEIGGFVPGFRERPPAEIVTRRADGLEEFLREFAELAPRVHIVRFAAEARGGGVYRVRAVIANRGGTPLALAQGIANRHVRNGLATLRLPRGALLSGLAQRRLASLPAGGREELEWWVDAPAGTPLELDVETVLGGSAQAALTLGARREGF